VESSLQDWIQCHPCHITGFHMRWQHEKFRKRMRIRSCVYRRCPHRFLPFPSTPSVSTLFPIISVFFTSVVMLPSDSLPVITSFPLPTPEISLLPLRLPSSLSTVTDRRGLTHHQRRPVERFWRKYLHFHCSHTRMMLHGPLKAS
jgi:hypothetical protein